MGISFLSSPRISEKRCLYSQYTTYDSVLGGVILPAGRRRRTGSAPCRRAHPAAASYRCAMSLSFENPSRTRMVAGADCLTQSRSCSAWQALPAPGFAATKDAAARECRNACNVYTTTRIIPNSPRMYVCKRRNTTLRAGFMARAVPRSINRQPLENVRLAPLYGLAWTHA